MGLKQKLFGQSYGVRVESEYKTAQGVKKATTNLKTFMLGRKK